MIRKRNHYLLNSQSMLNIFVMASSTAQQSCKVGMVKPLCTDKNRKRNPAFSYCLCLCISKKVYITGTMTFPHLNIQLRQIEAIKLYFHNSDQETSLHYMISHSGFPVSLMQIIPMSYITKVQIICGIASGLQLSECPRGLLNYLP